MTTFVICAGVPEHAPQRAVNDLADRVYGLLSPEVGEQVVFDGAGVGVYEGLTEDAVCFVVVAKRDLRSNLAATLADWAATYGEECVALVEGTTTFINAKELEFNGCA
jgi:hypothetical protein